MNQYIIIAFATGAVLGSVITFWATLWAWCHKRHDDISRPDGKQHEPQHGADK